MAQVQLVHPAQPQGAQTTTLAAQHQQQKQQQQQSASHLPQHWPQG
jgi:hypothetical protein